MTPHKLRRWAGNLAAAGLAVGLVLASCEIAARIALANRRGKEGAEVQSYTEFDSDLGWVKRPGAHARYTRTEYTVDISINSLGMRDRERTVDPPPDTQRVLALGDSFVEGYTVSADEMATRVMERTLGRPGCRVEVLNGGTAGYSTDQELIFYRKTGRSFKASTVVLFFYYNDILANASFTYSARSKPLFASHNGQLSLARPAFPSEPEPVAAVAPRTLPRGSAAWAWLKDRLMRGAPRTYNRLASLGLWPPLEPTRWIPDEMLVYRNPYPRRIGAAWHLTELLLAALSRDVAQAGAHFLVAYVPASMEVRDASWDVTRTVYGMGRKWSRDAVVRHLEEVGRRRGFDVLDLTPELRGAEAWWRTTYFTYDPHWNSLGHLVAGRAVAQELTRRGWIQCRAAAPAPPSQR